MRNPRIEELFSGLSRSVGLQALLQRLDAAASFTEKPVLRLSGLTLTAKAAYAALLLSLLASVLYLIQERRLKQKAPTLRWLPPLETTDQIAIKSLLFGLPCMTAGLLTQGTKTRSSRDLAEELTSIGAALDGGATPDLLTIGGSGLAENTAKLLELLSDIALNANFPDNEVQLRKQNRKQALLAQRSQPAFLATEKFDALIFGDHPYADVAPTMESIDRMDQKSLVDLPLMRVSVLFARRTLPSRAGRKSQRRSLSASVFTISRRTIDSASCWRA